MGKGKASTGPVILGFDGLLHSRVLFRGSSCGVFKLDSKLKLLFLVVSCNFLFSLALSHRIILTGKPMAFQWLNSLAIIIGISDFLLIKSVVEYLLYSSFTSNQTPLVSFTFPTSLIVVISR